MRSSAVLFPGAILSIAPVLLALSAPSALAFTGGDIAALASANVGKGACSTNSKGTTAFVSSCTGNGGQPEYWCADFARWVWAEVGVQDTSSLTAAAGSFYLYGQAHGTLSTKPSVGDAVVFDYAGNGYADHVALVTQVNSDGTIETMSGDWDGQSGTEAHFSSTSHVVLNAPAYPGVEGTSPSVMGMTLSAFVSPVGAAPPPPPELQASFVTQSSDAPKDPTGKAYFQVCAGASFHFSFTLKNTGSAEWTDVGDTSAGAWGKAIRLGVPGDQPDVFTGTNRVSINVASSKGVAPGAETQFAATPGITGKAPSTPGIYKTTWQLVDEGRAWFGPGMWLSYDVVACGEDAGADAGAGMDAGTGADAGGGRRHRDAGAGAGEGGVDPIGAGEGGADGEGGGGGGCSVGMARRAGGGAAWAFATGLGIAGLRRRRPRGP